MDRYKHHGMNFQPGDKLKRELRAHRRSMERRRSRQILFDATREIDNENTRILETVAEDDEVRIQRSQDGSLSRKEILRRWKAEKELTKKLEAQIRASKPAFKVCRVEHTPPSFLASSSAKNTFASDRRVTRAVAKALAAAPTMTLRSSKAVVSNVQSQVATKKRAEGRPKKPSATVVAASHNSKTQKVTRSNRVSKPKDTSFAPTDYEFVPIAGIAEFPLLAPLSPKSADSFLIPISYVDECERGEGMASPEAAVESRTDVGQSTNTLASVSKRHYKISPLIYTSPFINRERRSLRRSKIEAEHVPLNLDDDDLKTEQPTKPDVLAFRTLLKTNSDALTSLCDEWSRVMEKETLICNSVVGRICSAIGKANLLMSERFQQFKQLVDDCEFVRGEKVTTCSDLEGFWEMINIQVEEVRECFGKLDRIRANGFEEEETPIKKAVLKLRKSLLANKAKAKKVGNAERSRAARQRLADFKAKAAAKMRRKTEEAAELCATSSFRTPAEKSPKRSRLSVSASPVQDTNTSEKRTCSRGSRRVSLRHSILSKNFADSSFCGEQRQTPNSVDCRLQPHVFSPLPSGPLSFQAPNMSSLEIGNSPRKTDRVSLSNGSNTVDKENLEDSVFKNLEPRAGRASESPMDV